MLRQNARRFSADRGTNFGHPEESGSLAPDPACDSPAPLGAVSIRPISRDIGSGGSG